MVVSDYPRVVRVSERVVWALLAGWVLLFVLNVTFGRSGHAFWLVLAAEILGIVAAALKLAAMRRGRLTKDRETDV